MKAYKGFHKTADGLKCRDKIYLPGETYTEDEAELCQIGMHACLEPIDVLTYYAPASSVFHVVEVGDDAAASDEEPDSKVVTKTLTVGAELGIHGLVQAQVEYTTGRAVSVDGGRTSQDQGAAVATGYKGAASATGYQGAASATGELGAASATGYRGAASATGELGAAVATGDLGVASSTGYRGTASTLGYRGVASATGRQGVASVVSDQSVSNIAKLMRKGALYTVSVHAPRGRHAVTRRGLVRQRSNDYLSTPRRGAGGRALDL